MSLLRRLRFSGDDFFSIRFPREGGVRGWETHVSDGDGLEVRTHVRVSICLHVRKSSRSKCMKTFFFVTYVSSIHVCM